MNNYMGRYWIRYQLLTTFNFELDELLTLHLMNFQLDKLNIK